MKKLLALMLIAVLALSLLTACSVNYNDGSGSDKGGEKTEIDFGAIMSGGAGNFNDLSPSEKQDVIDAGKKDGVDVSFNADGSVSFVDVDGATVVQNADGSWDIKGDDGGDIQFSTDDKWPDNKYTKLVPAPEFSVTAVVEADDVFTVLFAGATLEKIKAYAEKVKAAGFDVDPDVEDVDYMGIIAYSYEAKNTGGYKVMVYFSAGVGGLTMEAP